MYGAIQQHLEPEHIRGLLIPIPETSEELERVSDAAKRSIEKREELEDLNAQVFRDVSGLIASGIVTAQTTAEG